MEKMAEYVDELLRRMEKWCEDNDGDMLSFFGEGSIYGEDGEGNWIVGFGVFANAALSIGCDCLKCGGYRSAPFSDRLARGIAEVREILENC